MCIARLRERELADLERRAEDRRRQIEAGREDSRRLVKEKVL